MSCANSSAPPMIHFGIETEIGIARDSEETLDVVAESIALVRSAKKSGVLMRWDYQCEDPHADARGFRMASLRQDSDEAHYFEQDAARELSFVEIKSDLALGNGARFYNDHAHPEYCTPECGTLEELSAHDRAGERILMRCAQKLSEERGGTVRLYKNNTDFRGHSYGCHENYLLPRSLPWELLARAAQGFLVTRQIFAGAGKFALEEEDRFAGPGFQIAQRSDFFSELQSVDTMQRRPIINTRDEPHANPDVYRRFHVILGDANMSPFATRLKAGATALMLEVLVRNPRWPCPVLADPLRALREISRDPEVRRPVALEGGAVSSALAVQRAWCQAAAEFCDLTDPARAALWADWNQVLTDLEADPMRCRDRLDWVAKLALIRQFQAAQNIGGEDPWLRSLDLEYHRLDMEAGLYYALEQSGAMAWTPDEAAVRRATSEPPSSTRACIRGRCIQKFPRQVLAAQWDHITLQGSRRPLKISLLNLFAPEAVAAARQAVEAARQPDDLAGIAEAEAEAEAE
jgi:proteasome accessory factor A